jgi:putative redox protein
MREHGEKDRRSAVTQVVVTSDGNLRQEIWAGKHTLAADEPVEAGGDDTGPSPYELLLAALGACTSMTLLLYARRKGMPLEHVEVRLHHQRIHAQDCAECEQKEGYLDHVDKEIVVSGPLAEEQVRRLGEIAEKCPVNRTLHASVHTTQKIRLAGSEPRPD